MRIKDDLQTPTQQLNDSTTLQISKGLALSYKIFQI